jgi:hypothetical protein
VGVAGLPALPRALQQNIDIKQLHIQYKFMQLIFGVPAYSLASGAEGMRSAPPCNPVMSCGGLLDDGCR